MTMVSGKVKMLIVLLQAAMPISGLATGPNRLSITLDKPQPPNSVLENTADTARRSTTESLDPVLALSHPSNTVQRLKKRSVSESIKVWKISIAQRLSEMALPSNHGENVDTLSINLVWMNGVLLPLKKLHAPFADAHPKRS
ncbi:hypothetical protein PTTG_27952, partial [Puccinia triticina 1-1 BBBD Race 1]|uniref:Uncharacterized protein n=2 Tax=Puccinia triticina TaxID=208348 RepID=A0ABY7D6K1_9BASI